MKYDDISWHYNSDFPKELEIKNAGTHIGMFIGWIIKRGFESDFLRKISNNNISKVKDETISGTDFLINYMDGKFTDEDLNEEGKHFAEYYYDTDEYLNDYEETFSSNLPSIFHVDNTRENRKKIEKKIDSAYKNFLIKS